MVKMTCFLELALKYLRKKGKGIDKIRRTELMIVGNRWPACI